jgi:Cdc6-like AAA superfamily ATPase
LFCPGIPGAGKTIITSIVVEYLQINQENSSIAYLYCNVGRQHEQTLENLLKSILKQLVQTQPNLPKSVKDLYERHKKNQSQPRLQEISEILQTIISLDSRTFIIVDALDECQNRDGCRDNLLSQIFALQTKTRLNIFATSRHQEVETQFSGCISLEIRAIEEDIKSYLNDQISLWEKSHCDTLDDDLRDRIKTEITKEAEGM